MRADQQDARDSARRRRRGHDSSRGAAVSVAIVVLVAGLLTAATWFAPGGRSARAADGSSGSGGQKITAFEDVTIGPDESWENVVVVGGDLVVRGTVENAVVVVGGDLTIGREASVGAGANPDDAAVVSVFGDVTVEPGGSVIGRTVDVAGGISDLATTTITDPVLRPWRVGSIVSWIATTVGLVIVTVIIVAIAPRQVAVVRDRVRRRFFSSLGWGALGAIVVGPIVTALLIVTVIGIVLLVPWVGVALPVLSLFGIVAVGTAVGRVLLGLREDKRVTLMAEAVVGVVVVTLARWIPVAGAVILGLLWLVGFGATYVAMWDWRREKQRGKLETAARAQAAGLGATNASGVSPYDPPAAQKNGALAEPPAAREPLIDEAPANGPASD
ncbi:MAG: hypothetical protein V1912_07860 [bacterium]